MRPRITLEETVLRANAEAWGAYCGQPVWAVVKSDGYGWGARALAHALGSSVAGFYVADADEFRELRPHTSAPIAIFADVPAAQIEAVLDAGGIPNIGDEQAARAALAWARLRGRAAPVRVGVLAAVGWSGIAPREIPVFAPCLRGPLAVTLWTHLTDPALAGEQLQALNEAVATCVKAGVTVAGFDCESTASCVWHGGRLHGTHARIGVGLFGSRGATDLAQAAPDVRCAIRVEAPVSRRSQSEAGRRIGYGDYTLDAGCSLVTVRCGYGDGLPRGLSRSNGIVSIGMQYTTCVSGTAHHDSSIVLIDDSSDLLVLAARAKCLPHEIVVALGAHRSPRPSKQGPGGQCRNETP